MPRKERELRPTRYDEFWSQVSATDNRLFRGVTGRFDGAWLIDKHLTALEERGRLTEAFTGPEGRLSARAALYQGAFFSVVRTIEIFEKQKEGRRQAEVASILDDITSELATIGRFIADLSITEKHRSSKNYSDNSKSIAELDDCSNLTSELIRNIAAIAARYVGFSNDHRGDATDHLVKNFCDGTLGVWKKLTVNPSARGSRTIFLSLCADLWRDLGLEPTQAPRHSIEDRLIAHLPPLKDFALYKARDNIPQI